MATPKLDRIITEFANRIGSPATFDNGVLQNGSLLKAYEIVSYVNKALFKLFNEIWANNQFDKFPELLSPPREIDVTGGIYNIASPNLNMFKIFNCYTGTHIVKIWPEDKFAIAKLKTNRHYISDENNPAVIQLNSSLHFFPSTITKAFIIYLIAPLNPENGNFLDQNGAYDSPFSDQWNSKIAEIAEQLYRTDAQDFS